jgi:hypothetical protein
MPFTRSGFVALTLWLALLGGAAVAQTSPGDAPSVQQPAPLPPIVSFSRSNSGWTANFSFADPVIEIQWSFAKEGPFESTGFLPVYDPQTRRPMANPGIGLEREASPIYVRYADMQGNWVGPFAVVFEPVAEIERWHRSILESTFGSWLSFRENILYYTHISGYRCGIKEFRVGLDAPMPDRIVKLAPCDMRDPVATPRDVDTHLWIDPKVMFASAQIVYRDGTVSKVRIFRRGATDLD